MTTQDNTHYHLGCGVNLFMSKSRTYPMVVKNVDDAMQKFIATTKSSVTKHDEKIELTRSTEVGFEITPGPSLKVFSSVEGIKPFSFKRENTNVNKRRYVYESHTVGCRSLRLPLTISSKDLLDDDFTTALQKVIDNDSAKKLLQDFGTHVISYCEVGGVLNVTWDSTFVEKKTTIKPNLQVATEFIKVGFSFDRINGRVEDIQGLQLSSVGGEPVSVALSDAKPEIAENWLKSLATKNTMIYYGVTPIYEYVDHTKRALVKMAYDDERDAAIDHQSAAPRQIVAIQVLSCVVDTVETVTIDRNLLSVQCMKRHGSAASNVQFMFYFTDGTSQPASLPELAADENQQNARELHFTFGAAPNVFRAMTPSYAPFVCNVGSAGGNCSVSTTLAGVEPRTVLTLTETRPFGGWASFSGTISWEF